MRGCVSSAKNEPQVGLCLSKRPVLLRRRHRDLNPWQRALQYSLSSGVVRTISNLFAVPHQASGSRTPALFSLSLVKLYTSEA